MHAFPRVDGHISTLIALVGLGLLVLVLATPVPRPHLPGPVIGLLGLGLLTWGILAFGARTRPE